MPSHALKFGWLSPVIGNRFSEHKPIVVYQAEHILPTVNDTFDSLWIADHFYGMDAKTDPFMEAWTTLTWLAAKFPDLDLCHHVLGQGIDLQRSQQRWPQLCKCFLETDSCSASVQGGGAMSTRPTGMSSRNHRCDSPSLKRSCRSAA